jgi:hypothetical protein
MSDISQIINDHGFSFAKFKKIFLLDMQNDHGVAILQVVYSNSIYSKPPEDSKLRRLWPEYQWLNVSDQKLIPIDAPDIDPITYNTIYSTE